MVRPKMKLTVIFLLLSGRASLPSGQSPPHSEKTLCELLQYHRYEEMGLLSITWYTFAYGLYIFTQPGYRYYELPLEKVTYDSMDLSQASPLDMTQHSQYKEAFAPVKGMTHKGTYLFSFFYMWKWDWSAFKLIILIVTYKGTRTLSYRKRYSDAFTEVTLRGGALPDFTMAGLGYDSSNVLTGYVLSADLDRFPGIIILREYKVFWDDSNVTGLPLPAGQTDDRPFFFLQVLDHPDEVFLVHSGNKPDPEAQLLRSVPRSFLYDKKHLVLFDSLNGCVHVIADFAGFNVEDRKSRAFKRSNYPFEVYFKCGKPIDNPNPNRCNVVRGSHRPTDITPENPETPRPETTESVVSFSLGRTLSVCLLVVMAVLAVGLLYAIMTKKDKGRSAVKSSTSSSAISGTSKPRNKRSTVANSSISGHGAKSKSTSKVAKKRETSQISTSK